MENIKSRKSSERIFENMKILTGEINHNKTERLEKLEETIDTPDVPMQRSLSATIRERVMP